MNTRHIKKKSYRSQSVVLYVLIIIMMHIFGLVFVMVFLSETLLTRLTLYGRERVV